MKLQGVLPPGACRSRCPQHLLPYVGGVCNFPSSVLKQQKFEATDGPALQLTFIWQAKENTSWRLEGGPSQKTQREERSEAQFWLLFSCFFLLSLSLPYVNWTSQEGCLFHLRFSFQSSRLPLFFFCGLFPPLSFSHHHSGLLFPTLTT